MAFVNEYASEEDINKYELDKIWLKYHPVEKLLPNDVRLYWTVDHKEDVFLMHVKIGREEVGNRHTFVFQVDGESFEVKLDILSKGSMSFKERPYMKYWEFVGIWPTLAESAEQNEILKTLKKALRVYGYDGARRQIPETIVEFDNF